MADLAHLLPGSMPWLVVAIHRGLSANGIVHGFGGAIALAYATDDPRATLDVDVNVVADPGDPIPALSSLPDGVAWTEGDAASIRRDGQVRLHYLQPAGMRIPIDLFFPQHAFHGVVAARIIDVPFAGDTIPVISATDILIFKALFNRPKDWIDIMGIVREGTADVTEAFAWIERLVGRDSDSYRRLATLTESRSDEQLDPLWRDLFDS